MANRAIIYRLYPTASQKLLLTKTFGCCRFVYNRLLSVQQERYKNGEKHLSRTHANNFCNRQLKPAYPFLREVDKFALTNAIYHLEDGYQRFFKHLGNFPKYKSKRKATKAYTTNSTNENIKIGEQYIQLPKLGRVKAKIHRKPKEDWLLKSATVREFGDGTYQVSNWYHLPEWIEEIAERLRNIQIEHKPPLDLIREFDSPDSFFYLDPPYLLNTRSAKQYKHEMTEEDHIQLLETIVHCSAQIMISGYDTPLYNDYLHTWDTLRIPNQTTSGVIREEIVWMNYTHQLSLYDFGIL